MSLDDNEDEVFEVEKILSHTVDDKGTRFYYIKWKNYDSMHNTWEPVENLFCPTLLKNYHNQFVKTGTTATKRRRWNVSPKQQRQKQKYSHTDIPRLVAYCGQPNRQTTIKRPVLLLQLSLPKSTSHPTPTDGIKQYSEHIPPKRPILAVTLSLPDATQEQPYWTTPLLGDKTITVKGYGSYVLQFHLTYDPYNLRKEAQSFINRPDLMITSVIPSKTVRDLYLDGECCMMEIRPPLNWTKFNKFLHTNKRVAVLRSTGRPDSVILILSHTNPSQQIPGTKGLLCGIFINNLPPDCVQRNLIGSTTNTLMQYNICHAWIYVAELLMFPSNLMDLVKQKETVFKVFGGSALAEMVRSAIKVSHPKNNLVSSLLSPISPALKSTNSSSSSSPSLTVVPTRTVLLFDRSDGFLYQKSLQQERFSDDVSIFEFGCPTLADPIAPALEVYPKDTGGYITTDINNMLKDPDILDRMVELMKKSNATRPGTWQIILHTDFLSQIMRSGTGTIAQNVISKLLIYMDRDEIHVLENWMEVPEQSNWRRATLDWFNVVAQSHMHKHQAFYFVDDSLNLTSFQYRYPLIHFIQSKH